MTWSIQLTPWALPSLLAVLLVLRDVGYLWPRRREGATPALLTLAGVVGAWAVLQLFVVVTPSLASKVVLTGVAYVPAAAAPVLWAWFALAVTQRTGYGARWFMLTLYTVSAVTVVLVATGPANHLLFHDAELEHQGASALFGLVYRYGVWHWVHLSVRLVAVVAATVPVAARVARAGGSRSRVLWAVGAAALALAPAATQLGGGAVAAWRDMTPAAFALATALLTAGILHPRLLNLGPVARTLVMVELRDPIVVLDGKGHIVDANRAAGTVLGLHPYGEVPLPLGKLWARSRSEPGTMGTSTIYLPALDEPGERPFDVTVTPLGDRGSAVRSALVLRDVTARVQMERDLIEMTRELERLANSDPLTGLANRRHFMEALARETERAARYGRGLSLVLLDLDHFKRVNDTWGHASGDEVLKDAARILRSVCRDLDVPARLGGEELVLLLPETDGEGARVVAERVRERIQSTRHEAPDGDSFQVTTSIGVASLGPDAPTADALLHRADEALYAAKRSGRNRVVLSA
jgi:diguanylate cyclase (GGDEF)-like protein